MLVLVSLSLLMLGVFVFRNILVGCLLGITLLLVANFTGFASLDLWKTLFNSFIIFIELALLIFGSIHFYRTLEAVGHFKGFSEKLEKGYPRLSIIILLSWFLCSFFEGVAGFGVPTLLIAPLLITLSFKPITAIVVTLCANTLSVTYGALGTPIKLGLGVQQIDDPILFYVCILVAPLILFMPFALSFICLKLEQKPTKAIAENIKFLTVSGLVFCFLFIASATLTLEFSSAMAGGLGFLTMIFIFSPVAERKARIKQWLGFFTPYLLVVAMLIVFKLLLQNNTISFVEGFRKLKYYQPGIILMLGALIWQYIKRQEQKTENLILLKQTLSRVGKTLLNIFFLVFFALMLHNPIIDLFKSNFSSPQSLTFSASFIGVLGSFITGSLTMSNLIFVDGFKEIIFKPQTLHLALALLHIGGALGNAVSVQNILLANSVLEKKENMGKIIAINFAFVLWMLAFLSILTLVYHLFG